MEDTKPLVTENEKFQYRDETFYKALFGISEDQYFNKRNEIDNITNENVLTTKTLSLETLIEVKPLFMGDKGG